ncbi:MAG: sulfatase [bacterium]
MPKQIWTAGLLVVLVLGVALAWLVRSNRPADEATAETETPRPSVLIFGLDTWRGDYLHFAGMEWLQTPNIDALARDGVYFSRCLATAPWTGPSFASLFTGLLPYRHGFYQRTRGGLWPDIRTLAEMLSAAGYATGAYVTISFLTGSFGMDRGFQVGDRFVDNGLGEAAKQVTGMGQRFVQNFREVPFFLMLHYYDIHSPYSSPAPFDEMYYDGDARGPGEPLTEFLASDRNALLKGFTEIYTWLDGITDPDYPRQQYAAGVTHADSHVGHVIGHLKQLGLYDDMLILLTSDHGEHLGEHDLYYAHSMPYQEVLHVPLLIKLPGNRFAGTRQEEWVSIMDILPTVLEVANLPVPEGLDGRGLLEQMAGRSSRQSSLLVAEHGPDETRYSKTIVDPPWKLVWLRENDQDHRELYNLTRDPGETDNVAADYPDIVDRLEARLWELFDRENPLTDRGLDQPERLSEEERQRLRALGYID